MTGILLKLLIVAAIGLIVFIGLRRIWRDWTRQFRQIDKETRDRDLKERQRADVITLKRDKDGTFRPPDER